MLRTRESLVANTSPRGGIHPITMQSDPTTALAHEPGLRRLALRLAAPDSADDLVQSTWMRVLEHRAAQVRFPSAWLARILRNEHHMTLRSSRRELAREQAVAALAEEPEDPERVAQRRELARIVAELVEQLDDEVREVVRERYFDDMSAAEIARVHAIPAGTVRWRLKVGIDWLRAQLDARYGGKRAAWAAVMLPLPRTLAPAMLSAIIVKPLLLAVAATTIVGVATWRDPGARASADTSSSAEATEAAHPIDRERAGRASAEMRAQWSERVDRIRGAHARERASALALGKTDDVVLGCADADCINRLAADVAALVHGCEEFVGELPADVTMVARVIGAPDIGSVVESVALEGVLHAPPELTECLTESMVALELPPTAYELEQDITFEMKVITKDGVESDLTMLDDDAMTKVLSEYGVTPPEGAKVRVFSTEP